MADAAAPPESMTAEWEQWIRRHVDRRLEAQATSIADGVGQAIAGERKQVQAALDRRDRQIANLKGRIARLERMLMEKGVS